MTRPADLEAVGRQLGRPARGVHAVAHRCPCGLPDVVTTEPRLPDGTPFPTTFYLTCPRAASRIGSLEGSGLMREMEARLQEDEELASRYAAAHERYLDALAADVEPVEDAPGRVAYRIVEQMVLDATDRQRVLEGRDAATRLRTVLALLRRETAIVGRFGALPTAPDPGGATLN